MRSNGSSPARASGSGRPSSSAPAEAPLLVLFDLDGTLFLTPDDLYGAALVDAVREVYGHEVSERALEVSDQPGETAFGGLRLLLSADGLSDDAIDRGLLAWLELFVRRYLELLERADTSHWETAPGAAATLERLGSNHRLALLTGNPEAMARARVERLGLARFFPAGQGGFGSDGERRADLIGLARERAGGWPAEQTVLVGDTPRDVGGAHEAGVAAIGVTSGRFDADELGQADVVIGALTELPSALESL